MNVRDTIEARAAHDSIPGRCPDCDGPSATFKGTVHLWRCRACVDAIVWAHTEKAAAQ